MIGITILTVVCFIYQSSLTSASITVPYIQGMRLGDSFVYSSFKVGTNLIQSDVRNKSIERRSDKSYMKFKLIKSQKDKKDVLDISGELSLKVMAGLVDVQGKGAYLKSTTKSSNSVELLVQIYYRTATKIITDDQMKPISNWENKIDKETHYIRSITYGGYLIVSMKFTAKSNKDIEDIKAEIEAHVNTKKVNVGVKGQFTSLSESASSSSNLAISFTSSAIPKIMPQDLDTILKIIEAFPVKVKKTNKGIGVPIEVEIRALEYLKKTDKKEFVLNSVITGKIERFETMFRDLDSTFLAVEKLLTDPKHDGMSKKVQKRYGNFRRKIGNIKKLFYKAIDNMDLNAGANIEKLDTAFKAYVSGDKGFVPGKYARQLKRLQISVPLPESLESKLKKKRERTKYLKSKKDLKAKIIQSIKNTKPLEDLISGEDVTISFPRQSRRTYMINKGSPEMESVMVCYSAKITEKRNVHILDYSTMSSDNLFQLFWLPSNNGSRLFPCFRLFNKNIVLGKPIVEPEKNKWHAWCLYWDVSGVVTLYQNGLEVYSTKVGISGRKLSAGGTWVIGQDQNGIGRGFKKNQAFTGELRDVNVYANFNKYYFQRVAGRLLSSNTCQPKYDKNILKSWSDFKMGFVGNHQKMVKSSKCSNI